MNGVVVLTSLSPFGLDRQVAAMRSWKAAGFELRSLNSPAEAKLLRQAAEALALPIISVDISPFHGKPLPLIDDFIRYFRSCPGDFRYFGLINSDIVLTDPPALKAALDQRSSLVFGRRIDVDAVQDAGGRAYVDGYDYFFLSPEAVVATPESRFRIGVPWWDYWLPLTALSSGRTVTQLRSPIVRHVRHGTAWHHSSWVELGVHLAERLLSLQKSNPPDRIVGQRLSQQLCELTLTRMLSTWSMATFDVASQRNRVHAAARSFARQLLRGTDAPVSTYLLDATLYDLAISVREVIDQMSSETRDVRGDAAE
jgi:hypothetical protein